MFEGTHSLVNATDRGKTIEMLDLSIISMGKTSFAGIAIRLSGKICFAGQKNK